jgi:hypothetical protein
MGVQAELEKILENPEHDSGTVRTLDNQTSGT